MVTAGFISMEGRMVKTKGISFFLIIGVLFLSASGGNTLTTELKQLFINRLDVFASNDSVRLNALCTGNYQFINSFGSTYTVPQLKDLFRTRNKQIKSYEILKFQPFVDEYASMAFTVSEIEEEVLDGKTILKNSLIITEIYRKEKKKWKIQLTQISQKICNVP